MSLEVIAKTMLGSFVLDASFVSNELLTGIFGRSGSGKTTLINVIAGLVRPAQGRVEINGTVLLDTTKGVDVPAYRRRIGYVFQESRLFPHLSVRRNLLYGRWFAPLSVRHGSFDAVIELLGLKPLLDRSTADLSGGEKQRVSIGRALLASPQLLLMDEPLASLDDARKQEVMPYLERLRDHARIPIVYVSHSVSEIARLATALTLMSEGRVVANGPTAEVMGRIDLFPMTGRVEAGALLDGVVEAYNPASGLTSLRTRAGLIRVPALDIEAGAAVKVRIRSRDVIIAVERPQGLSALNILSGTVAEIGQDQGPIVEIALDCNGERVLARLTRHSLDALALEPGREVYAVIKSTAFDRKSTGVAPRLR